jgi:hypothetical protein
MTHEDRILAFLTLSLVLFLEDLDHFNPWNILFQSPFLNPFLVLRFTN